MSGGWRSTFTTLQATWTPSPTSEHLVSFWIRHGPTDAWRPPTRPFCLNSHHLPFLYNHHRIRLRNHEHISCDILLAFSHRGNSYAIWPRGTIARRPAVWFKLQQLPLQLRLRRLACRD